MLAKEAHELGAWLVHYSTDYVFDSSGSQPWLQTNTSVQLITAHYLEALAPCGAASVCGVRVPTGGPDPAGRLKTEAARQVGERPQAVLRDQPASEVAPLPAGLVDPLVIGHIGLIRPTAR